MFFPTTLLLALTGLVKAAQLTGDGTFYSPGLGACGFTNGPDDFVCAVSAGFYDSTPGVCGRKLKAKYKGKSVNVTVVDRCADCAFGNVDFSPAAFRQLADLSVGRIHGMTWKLV